MLWGLARASARPLPAVIDTPMARLDAAHRQHLVERYFPNASHQVVIFSTDTEVDRKYYQDLQPHIARAYHLNYDERDQTDRRGGRLLLEGVSQQGQDFSSCPWLPTEVPEFLLQGLDILAEFSVKLPRIDP